ncbi:MAG TPA: serine/threonine-protein kinase, partial [Longimicrobiales bacterium]|nr:serine/threonine-protein kinase [Longimicrobiales bacterium]
RYHFEHELDTGARGAVFRGCDRQSGRAVAIKLFVDSGEGCKRVTHSSATCEVLDTRLQLSHPYIPQIYEIGRAGKLRYEVMQLVQGVDLRAHIDPCTLLPLRIVLALTECVAGALQYLHDSGFVHGDVKPANIMFDAATGRASLTDVAGEVGSGDTTRTPAYMAPEQLRGCPASAAADQFSLGVTLYQLACGRLPFRGPSRPQIVRSIATAPHVDIRSHDSRLPASFAAILDKALSKDVNDRYSGLDALRLALKAVGEELDAQAGAADGLSQCVERSCVA